MNRISQKGFAPFKSAQKASVVKQMSKQEREKRKAMSATQFHVNLESRGIKHRIRDWKKNYKI
jgi:hypothetical protein